MSTPTARPRCTQPAYARFRGIRSRPSEEDRVALAIYFHPASMSTAQYDDVIKRLEAAGAGKPAGRLHHSCFGPAGNLMVYDVWDSQGSFDKFGETLMPILQEVGVDPGTPDVMEVQNLIQ